VNITASRTSAMADTPAVFRKRDRAAQVEALANSGARESSTVCSDGL